MKENSSGAAYASVYRKREGSYFRYNRDRIDVKIER